MRLAMDRDGQQDSHGTGYGHRVGEERMGKDDRLRTSRPSLSREILGDEQFWS